MKFNDDKFNFHSFMGEIVGNLNRMAPKICGRRNREEEGLEKEGEEVKEEEEGKVGVFIT